MELSASAFHYLGANKRTRIRVNNRSRRWINSGIIQFENCYYSLKFSKHEDKDIQKILPVFSMCETLFLTLWEEYKGVLVEKIETVKLNFAVLCILYGFWFMKSDWNPSSAIKWGCWWDNFEQYIYIYYIILYYIRHRFIVTKFLRWCYFIIVTVNFYEMEPFRFNIY
jgi:hypothetical protein